MSHYTILVIGDDVESQLQPYHEYESTGTMDEYVKFVKTEETVRDMRKIYKEHKEDYATFEDFVREWYGYRKENGIWGRYTNPNSKWDWWVVGGRWSGHLKLKKGAEGELGSPGVFGTPAQPGYADVACKGDVDWEFMRNKGGNIAAQKWDIIHEAIKDTPEHKTWEECLEECNKDIPETRNLYWAQPRLEAFKKACENREFFSFFEDIDEYLCDRETYIEREKNAAIVTYAVVKDGQWYQRGDMGWFGMSSNEISQDEWNQKYWELIKDLPDDTTLTVVDAHI